ncbi:hypothetical protein PIB30_097270, partial [Stylosanthes scabra]|nr:hypothetical protein [Stylosanthes scabra]
GTFDGGGEDSGCKAAELAEAEWRQRGLRGTKQCSEGWWHKKKEKGGGEEDHLPATVVEAGNGAGGVSSSSLWRLGLPWKGRRDTTTASTKHGVVFSVVGGAVCYSRRRWGWPAVRGPPLGFRGGGWQRERRGFE